MLKKQLSSIHLKRILLLLLVSLAVGSFFYVLIKAESKIAIETRLHSPVVSVSSTTATLIPEPSKPLRLNFTGDVMLGRHVEVLLHRHGSQYITESGSLLLPEADATFVNFESAMAVPHIPTPPFTMRFSTKEENLTVLQDLRVTHASLANNHGRDYGSDGLREAYRALQSKGITAFGDPSRVSSSSVVIIEGVEDTVAVIGIHTLFNRPTDNDLRTLLEKVNTSSTYQIAYIHWGVEYEPQHNAADNALVTALAKLGVDAVIGHHPHVVQDIDIVEGIPVFYSLGNFIFDQYFSEDVKTGYNLALELSSSTAEFRLLPHQQCALSVPCPMSGDSERRFLTSLSERSSPSLVDEIMAKTITFRR